MQTPKLILYLRKSSEADDRQAASIPAQERELREVARRRSYQIVGKPIAEARSAKWPGRPGFAELLKRLERKEADGVLCWHLDRLSRNPVDGGQLMWDLGQRVIRVIATPERTYVGSAEDKMLMSISFGMATKYSDDLAANIARGARESVRRGSWPGRDKLGYIRDPHTGFLIPDPERWDKVRQLWRWRLDRISVQEIHRRAVHELRLSRPPGKLRRTTAYTPQGPVLPGPTTRRDGRLVGMGTVRSILLDPFYMGTVKFADESAQGNHRPMVTATEFQQVLGMRHRKPNAAPTRLPFTYRGLITCGKCGSTVSPERHTNRWGSKYTYYHCSAKQRGKRFCPELSVEEQELERQIGDFLERVCLPEGLAKAVASDLEAASAELAESWERQIGEIEAKIAGIDRKLVHLRRLLVDDVLDANSYGAACDELVTEQSLLRQRLTELEDPTILLEPWKQAILSLKTAKVQFQEGTPAQKRAVVGALCSNLSLAGKTLRIQAKNPMCYFVRDSQKSRWFTKNRITRTLLKALEVGPSAANDNVEAPFADSPERPP